MSKQKKPTLACAAKTAVAYARYSSSVQRDVSIEQQLRDIRAFATREGYTLIHEYADHAKSGFKNSENRKEFQQMLAAAESGTFDTVIAWKVDRFGRNREESAIFKGRLRKRGVSVVYAMEPIPEGAAGVLLEGMLEATAEWYSRTLSENVTRGMTDNAMKCLYNGSHIYGYTGVPNQKYQINETEAQVVRRIYDLYLQGYGYTAVSKKLAQEGILNSKGRRFSFQYVNLILDNERYSGVYIWGPIRIPGGMPVIIERSRWEDAQKMKNTSHRHLGESKEFMLSGKLFCGSCGRAITGESGTSKNGTPHYYYACQGRHGKSANGCQMIRFRKDDLENAVMDFLMDQVLSGPGMETFADIILSLQQEAVKESPLKGMEQELSTIRSRITNIHNAIELGIWDENTGERLAELNAAEKDLRQSVEMMRYSEGQLLDRDRILFFLRRFSRGNRQDPKFRQFLFTTFINVIQVYPDHLDIAVNAKEGNQQLPLPIAFLDEHECSCSSPLVPLVGKGTNIYVLLYRMAI